MIEEVKRILDVSIKTALQDPKKSFEIAQKAYKIAKESGFELEVGNAYFCMAYSCRVMSDYSNGLKHALRALDIFEAFEDSEGILKVRNIIGIIYFYYGDYKTSLDHFTTANELFKTIENPKLESSILNNIGEIYRVAGDYKRAFEYYSKSLKISECQDILQNISIINANIGEIYYLQKDYEQARLYFERAYEHSINTSDPITKGQAQTKLGQIDSVQGDFIQANEHYISALKLFNQVNNKFYLVEALIGFSEMNEKVGRSPKHSLLEALNFAIESHLELQISVIYKKLVDYHEANREFEQALHYHKLYYQKEREIEASNLSMKLELLALEFDYYKEKSEFEKNKKLSEKLTREISESKEELKEIKAQNETLMEVSLIDELTQLYNRRGIKKQLHEKLEKSREEYDLILMIDIDRFKDYNDFWGHLKGDECLQIISKCLKNLDYDDYFIGRYGGEEFICYMKVLDMNMAIERADEMRKSILSLKLPYDDSAGSEMVTISVGGFVGKMTLEKINDYIERADKHLYRSKDGGRNKVSIEQEVDCHEN